MSKALVGIGLTAVITAGIGGIAYAANQQPAKTEAPMVVVPAAEEQPATGTPTVTTTTAPTTLPTVTAEPVKATTTAAPVKAKTTSAAPVESVTPAPAPVKQTVKKVAVQSDPTPVDPQPETTPTQSTGTPAPQVPQVPRPPLPTGLTPNTWTGQAGGDEPKVNAGN